MAGFFCGIIRFGLEFSYTVPPCGSGLPDPRPDFVRIMVGKLHYLHFGVLVFCLTGIMTVIISYLTEPIPEDRVRQTDFKTEQLLRVGLYWVECPYSLLYILIPYSQLLLSALPSSYFDLSVYWVGNT